MKNPNIKLGDLVKLGGLEKPTDATLKVPLSAKLEKVKKLGEGMSNLAEKVEDHGDVRTGEVTELLESMKKALTKELSPEDAGKILDILKKRFENKEKFYKSAEGVNWKDVQAKLEANPEKLWSLNEMEKTDGEPDLVEYNKKAAEYVFMDCSAESPTGRRNCVYDRESEVELKKRNPSANYKSNAVSMAALMGVELLTEKEYRELQTKGEFDKNSYSWLKTPINNRKSGFALHAVRRDDGVRVLEYNPVIHPDVDRAWRGSLRVK